MHTRRFVILDVFTDTPLTGNQLTVFTNATGMPEQLMQRLAAEFSSSDVAFVLPADEGGDFRLRIFTPSQELRFAGHPILGAAFAMAGPLQSNVVRVETAAGVVPVTLEREGAKVVYGWMEQPVPTVQPFGPAGEQLLRALHVRRSVLPVVEYDNGVRHVFVSLSGVDAVAELDPDMGALGAVAGERFVNVFAVERGHVKMRSFAPELGTREDAAAGSAAGPLALHLARHGLIAWGEQITVEQGSEIGRPSRIHATAHGDAGEVTRVEVGGSAIVLGRGEVAV